MSSSNKDSILEMFIYETGQLLEQLELILITVENEGTFNEQQINEVFRAMHTIKGSAAMMMYNEISSLAHSTEDLFYFIREEKPTNIDYSAVTDVVLESVDFIKSELSKIEAGETPDGNPEDIISRLKELLKYLKKENGGSGTEEKSNNEKVLADNNRESLSNVSQNYFHAIIYFEEGCEMENIRAFSVVNSLENVSKELKYIPADILDNDETAEIIKKNGFKILIGTDSTYDEIYDILNHTIFLKDLELKPLSGYEEFKHLAEGKNEKNTKQNEPQKNGASEAAKPLSGGVNNNAVNQSIISVKVEKLDKLMDLVGEIVTAESMVIENPDLKGLELENFTKAVRQLQKITDELKDLAMSIRMVPLTATFQKTNRIVRDMCKNLNKKAKLEIVGGETEVDKNVIEKISDPLMHIIRNSLDHGIELPSERLAAGKSEEGHVKLEAYSSGGFVYITITDDGKGLDKVKIYNKALNSGITSKKIEELSDREIFSFIFMPGFSTKEAVTEYSGRGVGMDVVHKNLETIGGTVSVESTKGKGSKFILKIPLTIAIVEGMLIKVGETILTIPTKAIKEIFIGDSKELFSDIDGNELIMIRGQVYNVLRLHKYFNIKTDITDIDNGVILLVENDEKRVCIFADEIIGEHQVVVKNIPKYFKKIKGLSGCALLGGGEISLIMDISAIVNVSK